MKPIKECTNPTMADISTYWNENHHRKYLRIEIDDKDYAFDSDPMSKAFTEHECKYIRKHAGKVSAKNLDNAIDVIIAHMYDIGAYRMEIDVNMREQDYAPVKSMTVEEIEKELGYKVKIVSK